MSRSTIKRYLRLRSETGDVKPKAIPGRPSKKGAALHARLLPQLETHPDATLVEHCQFWEATYDTPVSSATMSRAIKRLNWTRKKKTIQASEQNEADRAVWCEQAKTFDASKLVFIDECGSNIALTRVYARSPKGKRVYGAVPRNRRANMTLLAALSLQGMGEAFILEGSADAAVFELYIGAWHHHGEVMGMPKEQMAAIVAQLTEQMSQPQVATAARVQELLREAGFTHIAPFYSILGAIYGWIAR